MKQFSAGHVVRRGKEAAPSYLWVRVVRVETTFKSSEQDIGTREFQDSVKRRVVKEKKGNLI